MGPEWVAHRMRAPGASSTSRRKPDQKRRTQLAGGSKWSMGMVIQWWMGSAPPCWTFQNRSTSTSHIGRSPRAARS